jgi:RNA polymerase sigma factor (sigma-70 family)
LVDRYAPLVWGACRRACADVHAAEDAFQATFVALARQAGSIRQAEGLPGWLHGVARRTAWRARSSNTVAEPVPECASSAASPVEQASAAELLAAVEAEVARLPENCRSALLLCWFEDGSLDEAARRLGVSKGVLWGRLKRGRERLRRRLAARGFGPPVVLAAAVLTGAPAAAELVRRTTQAAIASPAQSPAVASWLLVRATRAVAVAAALVIGAATLFPTGAPKPPKDPPKNEPAPAEVAINDGFPLPPGAVRRFGNRQLRHPEAVVASAVSDDGKYLATASRWAVVVWDLKTLTARATVPGVRFYDYGMPERGVNLAFLPDSSALLVAIRELQVIGMEPANRQVDVAQVWDVATGKVRFTLKGPRDYNNAVWLTAGGKEVATILNNGAIHFYDAKDGKELRKVPIPHLFGTPWVSADGGTVAYQGTDGRGLVVVAAKDGKELFQLPEGNIVRAALSRDGRVLVYQDDQKKVRARDLMADKEIAEFTHPGEKPNGPMRLSADGKTLYFGSDAGHLYRWDLVANKPVPGLGRHSLWTLTGLQVSPDESTLYSMGWNKIIRRWDLKTGKELPAPPGYQTQAFMAVAADGKHLFVGDHATQLDRWDLTTGRKVRGLHPEANGGVNAVAVSPNGKWLATGRVVQDVQLWDLSTDKLVKEIPLVDKPDRNGGDQVQRVEFSPDSTVVYSLSPKTGTTAWEVPTGRKLWRTPGQYPQMAVDPKGRWVIAAGGYKNPSPPWSVLDAKTGQPGAQFNVEANLGPDSPPGRGTVAPFTSDLTFTPNGSQIVSGHYDGTVRVWDAAARKEVKRFAVGTLNPVRVALSPDAKWVGVGASEAEVSVWELATGKPLARFHGHQSWVTQVAFTRDGRGLLSNADLAPVLWDLCPAELPKDGLWDLLADDDAAKAYRAQWALIRDPKTAVALLNEKVNPADLAVKREQFDKWVADLDSPQFRAREAAEKALTAAGGKVPIGWVRKALADSKVDEPRARLTRILTRREKEPDPTAWRLSRAVQALELAGTDETRALLKTWAKVDGSSLAEDASDALGRIK